MRSRRHSGLATIVAAALLVATVGCRAPRPETPSSGATIADRVAEYGPSARLRVVPYFTAAGVAYPPARFVVVVLKRERTLEVYAANAGGALAFVRAYAVRAASGTLGPKLREGDRQVPEGFYAIAYLNPNSCCHLSLALDYPNAFDRAHAVAERRGEPGGDIMIHGGAGSIGCIAVGDEASEDLFVLAADAGWEHGVVVVSPVDFRTSELPADFVAPTPWTPALHATLRDFVAALPPAVTR